MATSKISWITAGLVSAAAACVGAVMAYRRRRTQATEDSYAALASGVLIGMAQGMQAESGASEAPAAKTKRAK